MKSMLKHDSDIYISQNELKSNSFVLNRSIKKLVENDVYLLEIYNNVIKGKTILPFDKNYKYQSDDLIWYTDPRTNTLYLLRCLIDEFVVGSDVIENNNGQFESYGFHNEFEQLNVLNFGIQNIISSYCESDFVEHENTTCYHRFGKLNYTDPDDPDFLTKKILHHSLNNINSNRQHVFFPYETQFLKSSDVIESGFLRKYDNGLLEYDLIFKLSQTNLSLPSKFGKKTILSCNNIKLNLPESMTSLSSIVINNQNSQYFYGQSNDIFYNVNTDQEQYSTIGTLVQMNRNDYVNAYSAKIEFETQFVNSNYSILFSDTLCQTADGKNICHGQNTMTFADRTVRGFTVIYVVFEKENTHEDGYVAKTAGLLANSFHCRVIGKWK